MWWRILAAFLLSGTAAAEETFSDHIAGAVALYDNLDYERALKRLEDARKLARTPAEEATVDLYSAVVLGELGRPLECKDAFVAAFSASPNAKLPFALSPKIREIAEKARQQVKTSMATVQHPGGDSSSPPATPNVQTVSPPAPSPHGALGWVLTASGGAALAVGGTLGYLSYLRAGQSTSVGDVKVRQAQVLGYGADALYALGAVGVGVGLWQLLSERHLAGQTVAISACGTAVLVSGSF